MTNANTFYADRAHAAFEAGFTSKAAKQAALNDISRAYGLLRDEITNLVLDVAREERTASHNDLYWDLPSCPGHWRARHRVLAVSTFPQTAEICDRIEELATLRAAVKDAVVVHKVDERVERVQNSVRKVMEQRQAAYARGLDLSELFGGLSVSANVHLVTNQHGTSFLRAFYFMHGRLTALNVILAVAQTLTDEAK